MSQLDIGGRLVAVTEAHSIGKTLASSRVGLYTQASPVSNPGLPVCIELHLCLLLAIEIRYFP